MKNIQNNIKLKTVLENVLVKIQENDFNDTELQNSHDEITEFYHDFLDADVTTLDAENEILDHEYFEEYLKDHFYAVMSA